SIPAAARARPRRWIPRRLSRAGTRGARRRPRARSVARRVARSRRPGGVRAAHQPASPRAAPGGAVIDLDEVIASHRDADVARYVAIADYFLVREDRAAAAVALDRAFGLAPDNSDIARQRAVILDELALREHDLAWRYVPAGTFLMGSATGDPDERPVHPR